VPGKKRTVVILNRTGKSIPQIAKQLNMEQKDVSRILDDHAATEARHARKQAGEEAKKRGWRKK
jgi:IS30 family transposase